MMWVASKGTRRTRRERRDAKSDRVEDLGAECPNGASLPKRGKKATPLDMNLTTAETEKLRFSLGRS